MSLLPKTSSEFANEEYWNEFFQKRGKTPFEWYGEFWQLEGTICNYIKKTDKLLIIGCGNSSLSADLYDSGYTSTVSIDISDVVIRQMTEKYATVRPDMQFLQMDAAKLTFEDEQFNVVLDKGTVDALSPRGGDGNILKLCAVLGEVARVLKVGGRFVCVSLLQKHVLNSVLNWFLADLNWAWVIRFYRCEEAEKVEGGARLLLPIFVVVFVKLRRLPGLETVTEICLDGPGKPAPVPVSAVCNEILSLQQYALLRHHMSTRGLQPEDDVMLDLCAPGSNTVRYQLYVCDRPRVTTATKKFSIFVVPQGREVEWLFGHRDGRRQLAEQCQAQRLVVVHLCRGQEYADLEQVKRELSCKVMDLAPPWFTPGEQKVLFLSTTESVGQREIRHQGSSFLSGAYVIEDITTKHNEIVRRLVFLDKPHVIQTEAKLRPARNKKKKKTKKWEVVVEDLVFEYYKYMVAGIAFVMPKVTEEPATALMIGLGGGTLPLFLFTKFPQLKLTVVELDPEVVAVAKEWFLPKDCSMDIVVEDGLKTLERLSTAGETFDLVYLDVDSKDLSQGLACPPQEFVEEKPLREMAAITKPTGAAVINLVCRNEVLKTEIHKKVKGVFGAVLAHDVERNVNQVLYLTHDKRDVTDATLAGYVQQLSTAIKNTENADISDLMAGLKVVGES